MTIALLYFQNMRLYPNSLSLKTQEKLLCLSQPEHVTVAIEKVRKKTRILAEREQSEIRQNVTLHFVSYLCNLFILFTGYFTLSMTYDPILKYQGIILLFLSKIPTFLTFTYFFRLYFITYANQPLASENDEKNI